jgi:hypothetical protein
MKKRLLPLLVITLLVLAGWYLWEGGRRAGEPVATNGSPSAAASPSATGDDYSVGIKFTGTLTADECADPGVPVGDVGCYIEVDGKKVIVAHGNARPQRPWGAMANVPDGANPLGKAVEVYAHQLGTTNFTLEGSSAFYVTITD